MATSQTFVACESVDPETAAETGNPGIVIVRSIAGGKVGLSLAMREASRLAKGAAHVAFHALRVDLSNGGRFPLCGDRLATREEDGDYVAVAKETGK